MHCTTCLEMSLPFTCTQVGYQSSHTSCVWGTESLGCQYIRAPMQSLTSSCDHASFSQGMYPAHSLWFLASQQMVRLKQGERSDVKTNRTSLAASSEKEMVVLWASPSRLGQAGWSDTHIHVDPKMVPNAFTGLTDKSAKLNPTATSLQ